MASKAQSRRNKKRRAMAPRVADLIPTQSAPASTPQERAQRPTAERTAHGVWTVPQGIGKASRPVTDLASDQVGRLYQAGKISWEQEQAARHFQATRAAYLAELPDVREYKSCLAGAVPGFDDGDGDALVIAAYRRMEKAMSLAQRREVLRVCDQGDAPSNLHYLQSGLDALAGC